MCVEGHVYLLSITDVICVDLMQMKGKREFPPDIPASGDVLSHLSESELLLFSLMLNTENFGERVYVGHNGSLPERDNAHQCWKLRCGNVMVRTLDSRLKDQRFNLQLP